MLQIEQTNNGDIQISVYESEPKLSLSICTNRERLKNQLPRDVCERVHALSGLVHQLTHPNAPGQPCTTVTFDVEEDESQSPPPIKHENASAID
jgi:hypothetical protein